ncbi:MAG: hypothetical protein J6Y43_02585, partial [Clostridia bacterium]|nr:hypothetical protein [Clostridia bacterium]
MSDASRIKDLLRKIKTDGKTRLVAIIVCIAALALIICINVFSRSENRETFNDPVSDYVYSLERKLEKIEERKSAVEKYGLPEKDAISLYQ